MRHSDARRLDEVFAPISLQVEERGQIAVIDARMRGRRDLRLGVIGEAEARRICHDFELFTGS